MAQAVIFAGKREDISCRSNNVILDIGFSAGNKTCGLVLAESEPQAVEFGEAIGKIVGFCRRTEDMVNLIIEAPLSVCFSGRGNPVMRSIEKAGTQVRPWYSGPGAAVTLATLYLIDELMKSDLCSDVGLFEAFISFKPRGWKSDHKKEVRVLREILRNDALLDRRWVAPDKLLSDPAHKIVSAFSILKADIGIAPVIKLEADDFLNAT